MKSFKADFLISPTNHLELLFFIVIFHYLKLPNAIEVAVCVCLLVFDFDSDSIVRRLSFYNDPWFGAMKAKK